MPELQLCLCSSKSVLLTTENTSLPGGLTSLLNSLVHFSVLYRLADELQDIAERLIGDLVLQNMHLPLPIFYKSLAQLRGRSPTTPSPEELQAQLLKLDLMCLPQDPTRIVDQYDNIWWCRPHPESKPLEQGLDLYVSQVCFHISSSHYMVKFLAMQIGDPIVDAVLSAEDRLHTDITFAKHLAALAHQQISALGMALAYNNTQLAGAEEKLC